MKRRKLTFEALSEMYSMLNAEEQNQIVGGGSGTSTDPYTLQEIDPLIENGTFAGGYVKDENGLVSYWMGVANIYGDSSSDTDDEEFQNFSSEFWHNWENGSDWWGYSEIGGNSETGSNSEVNTGTTSSMSGEGNGNWPHFGGLADGTDMVSTVGDEVGKNAGKTRVGSNGKFYFETRNGRVFYGNKYVGTTSLASLGKTIHGYAGWATVIISVYNVVATCHNKGKGAALNEAVGTAFGIAGGVVCGELGTCIGSATGPVGAGIGGIVGSIIGGYAGSELGSFIVEIGLQ